MSKEMTGGELEKDQSSGFVFTGSMSSMGNMTLVNAGYGQWNVKVSLKRCDLASAKKSITCDLSLKGMKR